MSVLSDFITEILNLQAKSNADDQLIAELKAQITKLTPTPMTWSNLNQSNLWVAPPNVGDTGGANPLPAGTSVLTPGHPLLERFTPAHPYNNAYIYLQLEKMNLDSGQLLAADQLRALTYFKMSLDLSLPQERKTWQALEFEMQYSSGGWVYNMAWQILPTGVLRAFQFITKQWIDTGLRCHASELDSGATMRFIAEFRANHDFMSETHTRLTVDGTPMVVNFSQPAESGGSEYFHCAFQVDTDSKMDTYTLAVNNISVEVA